MEAVAFLKQLVKGSYSVADVLAANFEDKFNQSLDEKTT